MKGGDAEQSSSKKNEFGDFTSWSYLFTSRHDIYLFSPGSLILVSRQKDIKNSDSKSGSWDSAWTKRADLTYKPVRKGPAHAGGGCGCESLRSLCVSFVSWDSSGVTGALMGSPRLSVVRLGHTTANTVYSVVASRVTRISRISLVTRTTATLPGWLSLGSGSMSSPSGLTN